MNLVLSENAKTTVAINGLDLTQLSLRGNGALEIEFLPNSEATSVNLNGNSHFNGSVLINVPNNVVKVSTDYLYFESNSSLKIKNQKDENIELSVKNLRTSRFTNIQLPKVTIQNTLTIVQTSSIVFDDAIFDNNLINCEIFDYDIGKWKNPLLKGNFSNLPSSISIINSLNDDKKNPNENKEYKIVEGTFNNVKCNDWISLIDFADTGFNSKYCSDILLDSEEKQIIIKYDSPPKQKNKLNPGQIAGIVIGCIAGVAIIVILVVLIVIKKSKNKTKNSENENDNNSSNPL